MRRPRITPSLSIGITAGILVAAAAAAATPAAAAPATPNPESWPELAAVVQPIIDEAQAAGVAIGAFVGDESGAYGDRTLFLGKQDRFTTASTIKLSLAATVMHQVEQGVLSLDDVVTLTPAERYGGSGTLKDNPFPQDQSIRTLLTLMIQVSDNTATNKLVDVVGGFDPINAYSEEQGIEKGDMHFGRKMFGAIVLPDGDLWVTPAGFAQLLDLYYDTAHGDADGTFLSAASAA